MKSWSAVSRRYRFVSAVASLAVLGACVESSNIAGPTAETSGTHLNPDNYAGRVLVCVEGTGSATATAGAGVYVDDGIGATSSSPGATSNSANVAIASNSCQVVATSSATFAYTNFPVNVVPNGTFVSAVCETGFPAATISDCTHPDYVLPANAYHGTIVYVTITAPPPPPVVGCTLTQGYWKNHEETAAPLFASGGPIIIDFGANGVAGGIGANADRTVTFATYQAFMRESSKDYQFALGQQLIAAELNLRNGATASVAVLNAMRDARILLYQGVSEAEKTQASTLNDILTTFNEGNAPGSSRHCDD